MSWNKKKIEKQQKEFLNKISYLKRRPKSREIKHNTEPVESEYYEIESCNSNHQDKHYLVKYYYLSLQLQLIR